MKQQVECVVMIDYLLSIKKDRNFVNISSDSYYIIDESDEEDNCQIIPYN